jgi:hypothetical protein
MHDPPVGTYRPVVDRVVIIRIVWIERALEQFSSVRPIGRMYPADPRLRNRPAVRLACQ